MARPTPLPAPLRELLNSKTRSHHVDRVPDPDAKDVLQPVSPHDVPPPSRLRKEERVYWQQFAPLLAGAKMLTPADEQTLADYCRACFWVDLTTRKLRTAWTKRRVVMKDVRSLDQQARGWVREKTMLADKLGLTAISRAKTQWSGHMQLPDKKQRPQSKVAELQERSRALRRPVAMGAKESERQAEGGEKS